MKKNTLKKELDWVSMLVPLAIVLTVCALFMIFPEGSKLVLSVVRGFLGDDFGLYYALLGVGIVGCTLYIAFSKFGKIKLGDCEKPQYRSFQWGTMIFTSTMAADILFYSLCEWALYANEPQVELMGGMQKWASTYPLFPWGPIAWGFYIVLAVAFGFMIHIRGRDKQKFSEACRPLLGSRVDGVLGRVIDLTAIFALIAGTATTFSLATPLLSRAISRVFGLQDSIGLTIAILLMIAAVYTFTVWFGMKGIAKLAAICSYCFFALLAYVLFGGGETRYILETGFSAIGNLVQNFIGLSTWMDPLRETSFPQNWTIYYWAYWMVWCVATPFFIGVISKGRTIRNTILGGYGWGLAGTFTSFIILGNYGLAQQLKHGLDITGFVAAGGDYSEAIMKIFDTLPLTEVGLILLAVTMIAFYSTTFDALTIDYYYNTGVLERQDNMTALKELLSGTRIEPGLCNKLFHKNLFDSLLHDNSMPTDIKINEDLLMNYFLFKEAKQTVYEDFCPYHYILRKGSAATSKKRYHVTDPLRVRDMIRKDLHGDTQLYPVAYSRYVYTLITAAVQKQWPEESNVAKRQLKQEFRSREILNCDSKKLRLMALGAGFMLPVYRSVRWGYDRITGVSRKYDI